MHALQYCNLATLHEIISLDEARGAIYPGRATHNYHANVIVLAYNIQSTQQFVQMENSLSVLQVNALVHAARSFPAHTPKRWSLVSELVILAALYEEGDRRTFVELQVPSKSGE